MNWLTFGFPCVEMCSYPYHLYFAGACCQVTESHYFLTMVKNYVGASYATRLDDGEMTERPFRSDCL